MTRWRCDPRARGGGHRAPVASNAILYGLATDTTGDSITLTRARWVYHYRHPGGLLGVAADGPRALSRLGAEGTRRARDPNFRGTRTEQFEHWVHDSGEIVERLYRDACELAAAQTPEESEADYLARHCAA